LPSLLKSYERHHIEGYRYSICDMISGHISNRHRATYELHLINPENERSTAENTKLLAQLTALVSAELTKKEIPTRRTPRKVSWGECLALTRKWANKRLHRLTRPGPLPDEKLT
jgi:hypothetical protein